MTEFGDEFIIESYRRIPWLIIWIQLVVTILVIVILFFGFNAIFFTNSDHSATFTATAASPPQLDKPSSSNTQKKETKVEDHRAKRDSGTSEESIREDDAIGEESSLKESMFLRNSQSPNHPCTYIVLVKEAFLKCLGLGSSSESSCNHQNDRKE